MSFKVKLITMKLEEAKISRDVEILRDVYDKQIITGRYLRKLEKSKRLVDRLYNQLLDAYGVPPLPKQ